VRAAELILLHGWATDNKVWEGGGPGGLPNLPNLIEELGRGTGLNIQNLNLPGHGTDKRWDEPTLKPAVEAVMDRVQESAIMGAGPVTAIGWSLGAQVFLVGAMEAPEMFESLVLVGATPSFVTREDFNWGRNKSVVKRMLMDMKKSPIETITRFCGLSFTQRELTTPGAGFFMDRYCTPPPGLNIKDLTTALASLMDTDLRGALGRIKARTLIVHGGKDNVCPVGAATYLAENIEGAKLEIFEHAGHAPFLTEPERFNRLVKDFIGRNV
jgi:pimeloyl-[acyl-carrier protein] methyl ester esterase